MYLRSSISQQKQLKNLTQSLLALRLHGNISNYTFESNRDRKLIAFKISYMSTKTQTVKQLTYVGESADLDVLKEILNGQIFYYQFNVQYETLQILSIRKESEIIKCKNKQNGLIKIAKRVLFNKCSQNKINVEARLAMKLKRYPHKYILSIDEIYREDDALIYIMDQCEGGTLFESFLNRDCHLPIQQIKKIIRKILKAIHHLHDIGIMHRDLKFDNIVLKKLNDIKSLKILDFGLATEIENPNQIKCGTLGYIAPEILNGIKYNQLCDIYSLGSLFHTLLSGQKLFSSNLTQDQLYTLNKNNQFKLSCKLPDNQGRDFIIKMVGRHHSLRPSAIECLEHPFLKKSNEINSSIGEKLRSMNFPQLKNPFHKVLRA